jgi:hypothetical protein
MEFRARLIAALDIEFVSATLDAFFERKRLDRGFHCFRRCRHGITSRDENTTADGRTEGRTDRVLDFLRRIHVALRPRNRSDRSMVYSSPRNVTARFPSASNRATASTSGVALRPSVAPFR